MRPPSPPRALRLMGAVAAACLLAGCAVDPGLAEDSASDDGVPLPATEGYQPLTVYLAVAETEAVPGTSGRPFGCGDLLVPVQTVPTDTEDEADAALDFLFADEQGWHGDPSLWNAVFDARETLTPTGHRREGDVEIFTFTGTVTPEDDCTAERIRAQLQATAAAFTSAGQVRLEVDGRDLDDVLGLEPLRLGESVDVPQGDPTPSGEPSDGSGEQTWAPAEESSWGPAEPTQGTWSPGQEPSAP
ncbi:hypothetical protein M3D60_002995 [Micrococcus luteus]|uniref:hypothetical protein n=1 Tax=Micrococcus TaxID=1269 RepID=UPI001C21AEE7|nr:MULTISPECIES: hypothetical protein [Micrococcus]MBU8794306.1 hypothetical protein [Micrococcus luteus]MBY0173516.1 hypothetical protein [Micrococcus luteus]MCV7481396.1 hypothetical protein [Micrococcus luteus]MCV7490990.1 hypothetical protein [Micrococcus luteus]MCV7619289.1 hypothetical protein [Micrococcus luteus]